MKILFLHKQILFPRDTGGKIRVLNILKHLGRRHQVTYVCNLRRDEEDYLPQMEELGLKMQPVKGEPSRRGGLKFYFEAGANLFFSKPFSVARNFDLRVREKVQTLVEQEDFDLVICDCAQMALHTIGLPLPRTLLFQHNVEAQILQRHAQISKNVLTRAYMKHQWHKMQAFERDCGNHFDAFVAVSSQDKAIFERDYGWENVHAIDTAVDADYFQPLPHAEKSNRVVFLGSMDWMPNQDGVIHFVKKIWPRIRKSKPEATFRIVGRNPPGTVRSLTECAGVEVLGSVPDVRPHLAEAAVVVVPLLVGGGTRLKIYEAMAMSRSVVSTSIGAEGLPLTSGQHLLTADDPAGFANAVIQLLSDHDLRRQIGDTANRYVRDNFGSERIAAQFEDICHAITTGSVRPNQVTPLESGSDDRSIAGYVS